MAFELEREANFSHGCLGLFTFFKLFEFVANITSFLISTFLERRCLSNDTCGQDVPRNDKVLRYLITSRRQCRYGGKSLKLLSISLSHLNIEIHDNYRDNKTFFEYFVIENLQVLIILKGRKLFMIFQNLHYNTRAFFSPFFGSSNNKRAILDS